MIIRQFTLIALLIFASFPAAARDDVVLQLRWDHQYQFAGYYAALWEGYYADEGIDVTIKSGIEADGSILSAVEEVREGRAQFGIGSSDIVYERAMGAPLVILASIFQESGVAFFAPKDRGMKSPADLVNLKVSRRIGDMVDVEMQAMLIAEGIDPDLVEPHPFDQTKGYLSEVLAGTIDVIPGYIIGTPHEAAEVGLDMDMLRPRDYGVDFYGDSLFTHERIVDNNPDLVEAFTRASIRGWEYALDHPDEIADKIIDNYSPRFPIHDFPGFIRFQVDPVKELTLYPVVQVGNVNPARWKRMHDTMKNLGMIEGEFDTRTSIFDPVRERILRQRKLRRIVFILLLLIIAGGSAGIAWIVTLRRTVEARTRALAEQERRYRELLERIPAVVYTFVPGRGGTYYSPRVRLLGYSPEELNEHPMLWYESIHPEDKDLVDRLIEDCDAGCPEEIQYRIRSKSGDWIWLLDNTFPRIRKDSTKIFDGIAVDITDLKAAEDQLQSLVKEKETLMQELNHRVKNNLLMVGSLIKLKDAVLGESVDLSDLTHQIDAIRLVHERLHTSEEVTQINLRQYIQDLLQTIFSSIAHRRVEIDNRIPDITVPTKPAVSIGLILNEIATNAIKYGFKDTETARFTVSLEENRKPGEYVLTATNNGGPFPEDIDIHNPRSLGLRIILELTRQIGGSFEIIRKPHAVFIIRFAAL
jgi:PAS domain S-box-containing protein